MEQPTEGAAAAGKPERQPYSAKPDTPGVVAPGPWIAFGALALGLVFDRLQLPRVINHVPSPIRNLTALLLISLGLWYIYRANITFWRERTPFQPWRPTLAIAARDIYGRTRNPMYQGFLVIVLGIAVLFRIDGAVLMLLPATLLIHYGVVLREERYLDRKFGEDYRTYAAGVPRYGWPLPGFSKARPKP
ncbi:MAG: hypothetical protein QOF91_1209 [Alphaproteobacteria bacterium]|jgi:protein-S-isoprenylcysteine O-methyltransferase Ste14|nr:hypothetical protein [Alphaproteobacteria bacterium]MEA3025924.1 hypothetical protein [Alphaproteobacteria bacterium]